METNNERQQWLAHPETERLRQDLKQRREGQIRTQHAAMAPGVNHEHAVAAHGAIEVLEGLELDLFGGLS